MKKVKEIISLINHHAPIGIQEGFDNSGFACGDPEWEVEGMLVCLDLTEDVVEEAIAKGIKLIVSHHPLIFKGLKNLKPDNMVNRILVKAIKNDLVIYSVHTNLDKVVPGVSSALADKLGLTNQKILVPDSGQLLKLTTFIPVDHLDEVASALFEAGAGKIGNYDSCSYQLKGEGTFRALAGAKPFKGGIDEIHRESEIRFEAVVPSHLKGKVVKALLNKHPYEEVAYDLVALENSHAYQGLGIIGELPESITQKQFLILIKDKLSLDCIRHTQISSKEIRRVALCGGSGSEFLGQAKSLGAQAYISADFKYHQFFEANDDILIADIGHYESEIFALEVITQIVTKKIPNFAVHLSKINTNPIKYL